MKDELERRSFNFEVRAEETDRGHIITGLPIVYGSKTNMGDFDEVIDYGALDGADLTDVRFLVNHDISRIPLARSRRNNGNNTMQFSIVPEGLNIDWVDLDVENNSEARALYSAVKRGDVSGMSFMFSIRDFGWEGLDTDRPIKHIKKIGSIVELSAVTFPAYQDTKIYARSKAALENARSALEKARQQRAASLEKDEVEKLKIKIQIM